jgi:4-hydroxy-4-methyl-2-oxoglutarate aldolase
MVLTAMVVATVDGGLAQPPAAAQSDPAGELRAGKNFIPTAVYSEEEDARILKLFEGLRVADVTDGMDAVGLPNIGLMDPDIHPLWRDTEHFRHRFIGIAVTARYVPTQSGPAGRRNLYQQLGLPSDDSIK